MYFDLGEPGWRQITCAERDVAQELAAGVGATLTDLIGRFGEQPHIYTEWIDAEGKPILRDHRWPSQTSAGLRPDARPCYHEVPDSDFVLVTGLAMAIAAETDPELAARLDEFIVPALAELETQEEANGKS